MSMWCCNKQLRFFLITIIIRFSLNLYAYNKSELSLPVLSDAFINNWQLLDSSPNLLTWPYEMFGARSRKPCYVNVATNTNTIKLNTCINSDNFYLLGWHINKAQDIKEYLLTMPLRDTSYNNLALLDSTSNLLTWVYHPTIPDNDNVHPGNNYSTQNTSCYLQFSTSYNNIKLNKCAPYYIPTWNWGITAQAMLNTKEVVIAAAGDPVSMRDNNYYYKGLSFYKLDITTGTFTLVSHFDYNLPVNNSVILKKFRAVNSIKYVFAILARTSLEHGPNNLIIFSSNDGKNWHPTTAPGLKVDNDIEYIVNLSYTNNQYVLTTFSADNYPKILISNDLIHWQVQHLTNFNAPKDNTVHKFYAYSLAAHGLIVSHFSENIHYSKGQLAIKDPADFQSLDNGRSWHKLSLKLPAHLADPSNKKNYTCALPLTLEAIFASNSNYILYVSCRELLANNNATSGNTDNSLSLNKTHEALLATSGFNFNSPTTTLSVWDGNDEQFCYQAKDGNDNKVYCLAAGPDKNSFLIKEFD